MPEIWSFTQKGGRPDPQSGKKLQVKKHGDELSERTEKNRSNEREGGATLVPSRWEKGEVRWVAGGHESSAKGGRRLRFGRRDGTKKEKWRVGGKEWGGKANSQW